MLIEFVVEGVVYIKKVFSERVSILSDVPVWRSRQEGFCLSLMCPEKTNIN